MGQDGTSHKLGTEWDLKNKWREPDKYNILDRGFSKTSRLILQAKRPKQSNGHG